MFLLPDRAFRVIETPHTGRGIRAMIAIGQGTVFGDYLGTVIRMSEYTPEKDTDALYLMYYTDDACILPDPESVGVHLLNHSCVPNCFMYTLRHHTLFFALRDITAGENLTISYLLSPEKTCCRPCTHVCLCGHPSCTGTMHLPEAKYRIWRKFQDRQTRKTGPAPYEFGCELPALPTYPKTVPVHPVYMKLISG